LEIVAAVAIGLNPYVGAFVFASLAGFTDHVVANDGFAGLRGTAGLLALLFGLAAPLDLVLGKFVRFAPAVRRAGQILAPAAAALAVAYVARPDWPLAASAAGAAVVAWLVSTMVTSAAARASRSPAWVGMGHIPVLMAAATAAACIVPLGVAKPAIGIGCAAMAVVALLWTTLGQLRSTAPQQRTAVSRRLAPAADNA
jgi:hypothetical protein